MVVDCIVLIFTWKQTLYKVQSSTDFTGFFLLINILMTVMTALQKCHHLAFRLNIKVRLTLGPFLIVQSFFATFSLASYRIFLGILGENWKCFNVVWKLILYPRWSCPPLSFWGEWWTTQIGKMGKQGAVFRQQHHVV